MEYLCKEDSYFTSVIFFPTLYFVRRYKYEPLSFGLIDSITTKSLVTFKKTANLIRDAIGGLVLVKLLIEFEPSHPEPKKHLKFNLIV